MTLFVDRPTEALRYTAPNSRGFLPTTNAQDTNPGPDVQLKSLLQIETSAFVQTVSPCEPYSRVYLFEHVQKKNSLTKQTISIAMPSAYLQCATRSL